MQKLIEASPIAQKQTPNKLTSWKRTVATGAAGALTLALCGACVDLGQRKPGDAYDSAPPPAATSFALPGHTGENACLWDDNNRPPVVSDTIDGVTRPAVLLDRRCYDVDLESGLLRFYSKPDLSASAIAKFTATPNRPEPNGKSYIGGPYGACVVDNGIPFAPNQPLQPGAWLELESFNGAPLPFPLFVPAEATAYVQGNNIDHLSMCPQPAASTPLPHTTT